MPAVDWQVIFGRWLIEGYPKVVFLDITSAMYNVDEWKREIWENCNIGIPWSDRQATEAIVFGFMTAMFLAEVRQYTALILNVQNDISNVQNDIIFDTMHHD